MTEHFKALSATEYDQLKDAIALITIYIAGADGKIDEEETAWAEKVTNIRSYTLPEGLAEFYEEVGMDFQVKLDHYKTTLSDITTRNDAAQSALSELNPVLAKLPPKLGAAMYDNYVSFAKHVAKASGGFLGFFSVGPKEAELLDLKMITPIIWEDDEA